MNKKSSSHHVVKNPDGGWSVKKGGALRASRTFSSQEAAVKSARSISENQATRLVVHYSDGRIKR